MRFEVEVKSRGYAPEVLPVCGYTLQEACKCACEVSRQPDIVWARVIGFAHTYVNGERTED